MTEQHPFLGRPDPGPPPNQPTFGPTPHGPTHSRNRGPYGAQPYDPYQPPPNHQSAIHQPLDRCSRVPAGLRSARPATVEGPAARARHRVPPVPADAAERLVEGVVAILGFVVGYLIINTVARLRGDRRRRPHRPVQLGVLQLGSCGVHPGDLPGHQHRQRAVHPAGHAAAVVDLGAAGALAALGGRGDPVAAAGSQRRRRGPALAGLHGHLGGRVPADLGHHRSRELHRRERRAAGHHAASPPRCRPPARSTAPAA